MELTMNKNVIFIMLDTLQFNYLGCYGNDWIRTPNIDMLAKEATLFENAYTEGLPTIPCRRAMLTGRYTLPSKGWGPLDQEDTTVADMLWGKGVHTGLIFDTPPMRMPKYGYQRGFYDVIYGAHGHELDHEYYRYVKRVKDLKVEDYLEENLIQNFTNDPLHVFYLQHTKEEMECYLNMRQYWKSDEDSHIANLVKKTQQWLEGIDRRFPFMLWLDSFDPHDPFDPPSVWEGYPCPYNPDYKGKNIFFPPQGPAAYYTEAQLHHIRMLFAEKITMVDKWIGKLLDKIKALGLWDNTMIILTSDHGHPTGHGEHGHGIVRKCRPWPYEELAHIPLLVRVPGVGEGERHAAFAQSVDIAPTIIDYLDSHRQKTQYGKHVLDDNVTETDMQGESLLPLIRGEKDKVRDFAIAGYYGYSWSIIREDYSFIHWVKKQQADDVHEVLEMVSIMYDLGGRGEGKMATTAQTEDMWSCTPGEVQLPDGDELYDRKTDPFQLKNIINDKPEKGKELLQQLKLYMAQLRSS
jgi:arylsulfatase A-like enzyme